MSKAKIISFLISFICIIIPLIGYEIEGAALSVIQLCAIAIHDKKEDRRRRKNMYQDIHWDLEADLKYLKKDGGIKLRRMKEEINVFYNLVGEETSFPKIKLLFKECISALGDDETITVLLSVYALREGYEDTSRLTDRRKKVCSELSISHDCLLTIENIGVKELTKIFIEKYGSSKCNE